METTKHGMNKYTKNEDYLHTDHFNAIVENVENLYTEAEQESEVRAQKEEELAEALAEHAEDQDNPHKVTAAQIGLGNVNNTADINKPVSILQAEAIGQVNQSLESHKAEAGIHHTHSNKAVLDQLVQADLNKLDGIDEGANKTIVDSVFSTASHNPVENMVIFSALSSKADTDHTHEGLMSTAEKTKLDQLKEEKVERNITIQASSFSENTDEYAEYYPYYADHTVTGMTETCWAEVNYTPATLALGCMSPQARTMTGKIRLYADSLPSASITIDAILWKEMN